MDVPSLSAHPLGTEGWDRQLGQRPTDGTPWDVPSLSVHPLGTEGWDGQLGQRPTDGTPWDAPHCPYVPWGLRDGMDSWDRGLQMGLHGMSLTVCMSLGD